MVCRRQPNGLRHCDARGLVCTTMATAAEKKQLYELQLEMCEWGIKKIESFTKISEERKRASIRQIESHI